MKTSITVVATPIAAYSAVAVCTVADASSQVLQRVLPNHLQIPVASAILLILLMIVLLLLLLLRLWF
jgi:hypothetical protein